jgi:hypothetical protein
MRSIRISLTAFKNHGRLLDRPHSQRAGNRGLVLVPKLHATLLGVKTAYNLSSRNALRVSELFSVINPNLRTIVTETRDVAYGLFLDGTQGLPVRAAAIHCSSWMEMGRLRRRDYHNDWLLILKGPGEDRGNQGNRHDCRQASVSRADKRA